MKHTATLRLAFHDAQEAALVAQAIAPENEGYVTVRQEGATLHIETSADAPLALLRTLDDLLACASAAQKAGRIAR